jgi:hypothetical protein
MNGDQIRPWKEAMVTNHSIHLHTEEMQEIFRRRQVIIGQNLNQVHIECKSIVLLLYKLCACRPTLSSPNYFKDLCVGQQQISCWRSALRDVKPDQSTAIL